MCFLREENSNRLCRKRISKPSLLKPPGQIPKFRNAMHGILPILILSEKICSSKPYYPTLAQSSSELGTNHSCGNSYIQRLRSLSFLWIIRNIQSPINKCFHLSTYSISFISHYNQSVSRKSLRIDYISIQECSINRNPFE